VKAARTPNPFGASDSGVTVLDPGMRELDVREMPPADRHDRIHNAFDGLEAGETLVVVNDHDPKPLFYEMREEVPEGYEVERRADDEFRARFPKR